MASNWEGSQSNPLPIGSFSIAASCLLERYRYINLIPLKDTQKALRVFWCELTLTHHSDGKVLYQNAFITRHSLIAETVNSRFAHCFWS
ncbi:hypothetical protein [Nostoc sp.]|uniref:hypothetical protein n=1 Tax=Nostoc sp. TaxID=1180 RepID=UPI002FF67FB7